MLYAMHAISSHRHILPQQNVSVFMKFRHVFYRILLHFHETRRRLVDPFHNNNNNNNNNHDDIYSAVIMTRSLREFTRFIW